MTDYTVAEAMAWGATAEDIAEMLGADSDDIGKES